MSAIPLPGQVITAHVVRMKNRAVLEREIVIEIINVPKIWYAGQIIVAMNFPKALIVAIEVDVLECSSYLITLFNLQTYTRQL